MDCRQEYTLNFKANNPIVSSHTILVANYHDRLLKYYDNLIFPMALIPRLFEKCIVNMLNLL